VLDIEMAALPCIAWASVHGVGFDRLAWESLARAAEDRRDRLREELDTVAPNGRNLFGVQNWDSPEQVKAAFLSQDITIDATDDTALAEIDHFLAAMLREYRTVARLATTYGHDWLRHVARDGRIYANWRQIGAGYSGRMSCKGRVRNSRLLTGGSKVRILLAELDSGLRNSATQGLTRRAERDSSRLASFWPGFPLILRFRV
jgi:DNA polymerase-1